MEFNDDSILKEYSVYSVFGNKFSYTMKELNDIDIFTNDLSRRTISQYKINRAYKLLDSLKDELIRENIKLKEAQKK